MQTKLSIVAPSLQLHNSLTQQIYYSINFHHHILAVDKLLELLHNQNQPYTHLPMCYTRTPTCQYYHYQISANHHILYNQHRNSYMYIATNSIMDNIGSGKLWLINLVNSRDICQCFTLQFLQK